MPIYQNRCDACTHEFESLQKYHDKPLRKCPECKKFKLYRVISLLSVSVKGSPSTLYHQAARNTEKMGRYEREEKQGKQKKDYSQAPSWRKNRPINQNLRRLSPTQRAAYIEKGVLPNESFKPGAKRSKV